MSNAIKFTSVGSITMNIQYFPDNVKNQQSAPIANTRITGSNTINLPRGSYNKVIIYRTDNVSSADSFEVDIDYIDENAAVKFCPEEPTALHFLSHART
jgi:hypothetical protein